MAQTAKPSLVYHADWGSKKEKRWCAKATLGTDWHYPTFALKLVGNLGSLIEQLRTDAGETGCASAEFNFPIGIPTFYAKNTGIAAPTVMNKSEKDGHRPDLMMSPASRLPT